MKGVLLALAMLLTVASWVLPVAFMIWWFFFLKAGFWASLGLLAGWFLICEPLLVYGSMFLASLAVAPEQS